MVPVPKEGAAEIADFLNEIREMLAQPLEQKRMDKVDNHLQASEQLQMAGYK